MSRPITPPLGLSAIMLIGLLAPSHAQLGAEEKWQCGNTNTPMDRWLTQHVVPDVFPPNEYLSAYVAPAIMSQANLIAAQKCAAVAVANWSPSCTQHDICMEARGANGKSSETCNDDILAGWTNACQRAYGVPGLGAATMPAAAWSQVFSPASYGNNATTYGSDITLRLFCQASCVQMAKASYVAMKTNTSTFPAQPVIQESPVPKPFEGASGISPYVAEVLGVAAPWWAKRTMSYSGYPILKTGWTDDTRTLYELTLLDEFFVEYLDRATFRPDPDEDYIFGYTFDEGSFSIQAEVSHMNRHILYLPLDGRAGLAIRNGNEKGSRFASISTNNDGSRVFFRYRRPDGSSYEKVVSMGAGLPRRLKLDRIGDSVTGYYADNAGRWIRIDGATIALDKVVKAGIYTDYAIQFTSGGSALPRGSAFFKSIGKKRLAPFASTVLSTLLLD